MLFVLCCVLCFHGVPNVCDDHNHLLFWWTKLSCCAILHRRVKTRSHNGYTSKNPHSKASIQVKTRIVKGSTGDKCQMALERTEDLEYGMDQQKDAGPVQRRARGVQRIASLLHLAGSDR